MMDKEDLKVIQQIVKDNTLAGACRGEEDTLKLKKFSLLKEYRVEYSYKAGINK